MPLFVALDARTSAGVTGRRQFGFGYLFGFVFFLFGTHWIAQLSEVAITVPWLKYPAWVAAAAYLALYPGLAAWLTAALARRARVSALLVAPFAFLAIEELRGSGELGFPWFQPGYTQHAYVPVLQLAALGSVTLVTLWLFGANALLAAAWRGGARRRALLGAALVLAFPWLWGSAALRVKPFPDPGPQPAVALVQGDIPGEMKWSGKHTREILAAHLDLTTRAAQDTARPVIAIWPETATGTYLRRQLDQAIDVVSLAGRTGLDVFSGFPDYEVTPDGVVHYYNAAGLFSAAGIGERIYAKRHLVPFGERMPFQSLIPALGKLELGQAEWAAGTEDVTFASRAGPFSALICFESIFPDLARGDVRRGARWLVVITNDEWFGNGAALQQHAAMAAFRAAENHVPLARAANTGITELIDSHGRVTARLPVFAPGVLVGRLDAPGAPTPFSRIGDWPGWLAFGVVVVLGVVAVRASGGTPRAAPVAPAR